MPRINSLALLGIVYSFAWFGHGEHEPKHQSGKTKLKRRRRKTPLELIQIAGSDVSERKKEAQDLKENLIELNAFDIDVEENDRKSKLFPDKIKEQPALISLQSEIRGIIGPEKDPSGEDSSDNNKIREYPVVQKINEMVKNRQQKETVEAEALMKMLLISDDGFSMGMSMSMPPANAPSELNTMDRSIINSNQLPVTSEGSRSSITLSKPPSTVEAITDEGGPSSSPPDSQNADGVPTINDDLPENIGPSFPPFSPPPGLSVPGGEDANIGAASAINEDEINSSLDSAGGSSSASLPTFTAVSILLSVMGFSWY